jgi:kynurenine formamidase
LGQIIYIGHNVPLAKEDIVLFERIANTNQLPDEFEFYGMPLNIKDGDGSPVRAFAVVK